MTDTFQTVHLVQSNTESLIKCRTDVHDALASTCSAACQPESNQFSMYGNLHARHRLHSPERLEHSAHAAHACAALRLPASVPVVLAQTGACSSITALLCLSDSAHPRLECRIHGRFRRAAFTSLMLGLKFSISSSVILLHKEL